MSLSLPRKKKMFKWCPFRFGEAVFRTGSPKDKGFVIGVTGRNKDCKVAVTWPDNGCRVYCYKADLLEKIVDLKIGDTVRPMITPESKEMGKVIALSTWEIATVRFANGSISTIPRKICLSEVKAMKKDLCA